MSIDIVARGTSALREVHPRDLDRMLVTGGLWLDLGAVVVQVHSDSSLLSAQLRVTYGSFPANAAGAWADLHVRIQESRGLRRLLRPQALFYCDGVQVFDPFPRASPLPLFEWGCNWLIGRRLNHLLLLHAGALERDGLALVLPATPGSGKSTLTAALAHRGWRLLSDEFGAFEPESGRFHAVLKPIALKNQSIGVIRAFAPDAVLGPEFPNTRKGTVAHVAPTADAVARRHEPATPGAIVLPRWQAGAATRLEPLPQGAVFRALAFNAFNYTLLGADGFRAVVRLVRQCRSWQLVYGDTEEAVVAIESIWPEVIRDQVAMGP